MIHIHAFSSIKEHKAYPVVLRDHSFWPHTINRSLERSKGEKSSNFSAQFSVNRGDTEAKHEASVGQLEKMTHKTSLASGCFVCHLLALVEPKEIEVRAALFKHYTDH